MANLPMKTLIIGSKNYEIIDELARTDIESLKQNVANKLDKDENAVSATKAMQDGNGKVIADTYATQDKVNELVGDTSVDVQIKNITNDFIKEISVSGTTITFVRGDGTTGSFDTQDTTYTLNSFGVTVSADEINYVDGVTSNIQTQLDNKATKAQGTKADNAMPKANFVFDSSTATLDITL